MALSVQLEATFLLGDKLTQGLKVLGASFVANIVIGDVYNREGVVDLFLVVSHPGESVSEVAEVWSEEDSEGIAFAAGVEDALVAVGEDGIEFVDSAICEGAEAEGAGTSAISQGLFESEGALRRLNDAANGIRVKAELSSGLSEGAIRSEEIDDLRQSILRFDGVRIFGRWRKGNHESGLYHEVGVA